MSRCTIDASSHRGAIDQLLLGGRSARSIALEFGLSIDAMKRHARNHVRAAEAPPTNGELPVGADALDELVASLRLAALRGTDPSAAREYRLALAAQAERHAEAPPYEVVTDPQWTRLRAILLTALAPFPEARLAVANALRSAGAD
jgi:hypothetical protein